MTTRTTHTSGEGTAAERRLGEIVEEFATEAGLVPGVALARVLFRDARGAFTDADGKVSVPREAADHPVIVAAAGGGRVEGEWPADGSRGVAIPVRLALRTDIVVWIGFDAAESATTERDYLLQGAIDRLASRVHGASGVWSDERRRETLEVALGAARRFHAETSLHRALRLSITELADLAGAGDASVWKLPPGREPLIVAQASARTSSPRREEALRRLAAETRDGTGPVRVLDTSVSDHYAWCHELGIQRFLAAPIRAFDTTHGVLLVANFELAPPLLGGGLTPGVESAAGLIACAAASAFHQSASDTRLDDLAKELRNVRRQLERADRAAARLDLARRAAGELGRALAPLADPDEERAPSLERAVGRALDVLAELEALSQPPGARLKMTSINDAVHDAVAALRARTAAANVSVRLQGDLPKLLLDAEKIREMLVNLIEHGVSGTERREAIVMTRLGKAEVVVELRFPEREIPGGVLESLFTPFSEEGDAKGRLGLALADQIIGEHGGQLRAKHEGEDGLTYWLSLPVADNQERRRRRRDRRASDRRRALDDAA